MMLVLALMSHMLNMKRILMESKTFLKNEMKKNLLKTNFKMKQNLNSVLILN